MPAELLKTGPLGVMGCLTSIFTAALNGEPRRSCASTGLKIAVGRNGDKADLNNYNLITVIKCWPSSLPWCPASCRCHQSLVAGGEHPPHGE